MCRGRLSYCHFFLSLGQHRVPGTIAEFTTGFDEVYVWATVITLHCPTGLHSLLGAGFESRMTFLMWW